MPFSSVLLSTRRLTTKLTPNSSNAISSCSNASSSEFCSPHVIVPRHTLLTTRSLFPSCRYLVSRPDGCENGTSEQAKRAGKQNSSRLEQKLAKGLRKASEGLATRLPKDRRKVGGRVEPRLRDCQRRGCTDVPTRTGKPKHLMRQGDKEGGAGVLWLPNSPWQRRR